MPVRGRRERARRWASCSGGRIPPHSGGECHVCSWGRGGNHSKRPAVHIGTSWRVFIANSSHLFVPASFSATPHRNSKHRSRPHLPDSSPEAAWQTPPVIFVLCRCRRPALWRRPTTYWMPHLWIVKRANIQVLCPPPACHATWIEKTSASEADLTSRLVAAYRQHLPAKTTCAWLFATRRPHVHRGRHSIMQGRPHRAPSRQSPPRRRGEAQLLAAAAARREAAEKAAAERERATAAARGKLVGQEQADRAALEVCCVFY